MPGTAVTIFLSLVDARMARRDSRESESASGAKWRLVNVSPTRPHSYKAFGEAVRRGFSAEALARTVIVLGGAMLGVGDVFEALERANGKICGAGIRRGKFQRRIGFWSRAVTTARNIYRAFLDSPPSYCPNVITPNRPLP